MGPTPLGVQVPSDENDFFHSKWRFNELSTRIGLVYIFCKQSGVGDVAA